MTPQQTAVLDIDRIRAHFDFIAAGRVVTNNAASTQPPRELVDLYADLIPHYENVHRGQSSASRQTTERFERSYDTIASWLNAPDRRNIALYRNATEAHNAVMYSLQTEFRDGDNVVTTMLEHNSNFVPWYALSNEILPRFGRQVECRVARFDHMTGELDLEHLASLVDDRTKLVCCTGASNFLGTKPDLHKVRDIAAASGYQQPSGERRSLLLVDGAQLVPTTLVDVQDLDVDYLSFSFHKMLAPFGVGVLYAKRHLLEQALPFQYGGDMIAEGHVSVDQVGYADLPWKYAAGTPNILGVVVSAEALRMTVDLVDNPATPTFRSPQRLDRSVIERTMSAVHEHTTELTAQAMDLIGRIKGLTIHGPQDPTDRAPLVAFTMPGWDPVAIANGLDLHGVESRAGCHCATLAHRDLGLDPPATCRLSFSLYNSADDVERAVDALRRVVRSGLGGPEQTGNGHRTDSAGAGAQEFGAPRY